MPSCGCMGFSEEAFKRLSTPSSCFIATAVYGAPTARKVGVLRRFRDEVLTKNTLGKKIVSTYQIVSPPMADLISRHELLRLLVRRALIEPIIGFLCTLRIIRMPDYRKIRCIARVTLKPKTDIYDTVKIILSKADEIPIKVRVNCVGILRKIREEASDRISHDKIIKPIIVFILENGDLIIEPSNLNTP